MTILRKPISIVLIGLFYLLSPLLNLVQIAWVTHLPLTGMVSLWTALTPLDWAMLLAFPLVGWGMVGVKRWGWVAFILFSLALIGYNTAGFLINHTYHWGLVVIYNVGLAAVTFVFFRKHLRAPYFNPRLQWWNADPRYPVSLRATLLSAESPCDVEVLDLSQSGLFLSTCADIELGQTHRVQLHAYGRSFVTRGKVMRKTPPDDPRPGFGVMFEHLDDVAKVNLKTLVARLVREGARERGLPPDAPTAVDPWRRHWAWQARRLGRELLGV